MAGGVVTIQPSKWDTFTTVIHIDTSMPLVRNSQRVSRAQKDTTAQSNLRKLSASEEGYRLLTALWQCEAVRSIWCDVDQGIYLTRLAKIPQGQFEEEFCTAIKASMGWDSIAVRTDTEKASTSP